MNRIESKPYLNELNTVEIVKYTGSKKYSIKCDPSLPKDELNDFISKEITKNVERIASFNNQNPQDQRVDNNNDPSKTILSEATQAPQHEKDSNSYESFQRARNYIQQN